MIDGISVDDNEIKALPSMPILLTSALSQPESPKPEPSDLGSENLTISSSYDDAKPTIETHSVEDDKEVEQNKYDDAGCDDLTTRADNSPICEKRKSVQCQQHLPKKKKKFDPCEGVEGIREEPGYHYAEAYFSKVKSTVDELKFQQFIALLSKTVNEPGSVVSLYKNLQELLVDYPELLEDFVGTLKPHQALEIGKLLELQFIGRCSAFFRKLEGNHLTRVIHALEQLSSNGNVTYDAIKTSILPLLKGHGPLVETFLHLLPNEKPPPPSSTDDYEDITESMLEEGDDGCWENARIPEHSERSCLVDCPCRCHTIPSQPFCLACNIRFIKGQVYVQYGKVIRYCKVHFGDLSHDEVLQRFNPALYSKRRRKRKSISKPAPTQDTAREILFQDENAVISKEDVQLSFSPTKFEDKLEDDDDYYEEDDVSSGDKSSAGDVFDEVDRHSEDTEDRIIEQINNPLSPLGSTVEGVYATKINDDSRVSVAEEEVENGVVIDVSDIRSVEFKTRPFSNTIIQPISGTMYDTNGYTDTKEILIARISAFGESSNKCETKSNVTVDSLPPSFSLHDVVNCDPIVKSEPDANDASGGVTTDSDTVPKTEALTQCEEEDETHFEDVKEWTRQEDKLILEAFQREIGTEETFGRIRNLMPMRSVDQIQGRFQVLMNLLEKVASGSHESNPN